MKEIKTIEDFERIWDEALSGPPGSLMSEIDPAQERKIRKMVNERLRREFQTELPYRVRRAEAIINYREAKTEENAEKLLEFAGELKDFNTPYSKKWPKSDYRYIAPTRMFNELGIPVKIQDWSGTKGSGYHSATITPENPEDMVFLRKLLTNWTDNSTTINRRTEMHIMKEDVGKRN